MLCFKVNHGPSLVIHDTEDSDSTSGCSTDMSNSDGGRGQCDCCAMNHHHHHHHHHSPVQGDCHHAIQNVHNTQNQAVWVRSGRESDEKSDNQLYEPVDEIQRSRAEYCSGVDLPHANCALQHRMDRSSSLHSPEHSSKQEAEEQCLLPPATSSQINAQSEKNTFSYISEINRQTAEQKLKKKPAVPPRNTSLKPK